MGEEVKGGQVDQLRMTLHPSGIHSWLAGTPADTEDTLRFAEASGVRPMIERYPLARAAEAYARMLSGKAEFRAVLTM